MSSLKRSASSLSKYSKSKKSKYTPTTVVPRLIKAKSYFINRSARYVLNLSTDSNAGYGFSATYLWINGVSTTSIDGASDLTNMFEMCRIAKVKCILLPGANVHEVSNDSITSGERNVPWVYHGADSASGASSTLTSILQQDDLKITLADKKVERTIYPKLSSTVSAGIIMPSSSWVQTNTDIPYYGLRTYIDVYNALTYNVMCWNFIITYECKNTK